jgi:asparagine synthase (glutamine-hydrolysing)
VMCARMRNRGPDGEGIWSSDGAVLGHRRLAVIDPDPRANQPMVTGDGSFCIVFNGEIYNFRELRADLEREGVQFHTTSDTEVLLNLFAREGERMLPKLRGMFALAIWDVRARELFLARDPYGIKPLYYSRTRGGLIFASQVKALLASSLIAPEVEPAGLAGFYLWGSVPEPWTIYKDVFALPAGSWMRTRQGADCAPVRWNDIGSRWNEVRRGAAERAIQDQVRQAMIDSVKAHLVSDVPVSVFLSGGIDSGVIAGLASELGARVEGITIGFDEFASLSRDEAPTAAKVATHYGLPHSIRRISYAEFEEDCPRILDAMDQPSIDGVNTWFASKAAAERGYKVVLSGVGGDELFQGYTYVRQIARNVRLGKLAAAVPGARALLKTPISYIADRTSRPKVKGIPALMGSLEGAYFLKRGLFLPDELPLLLGKQMAQEGLERLGNAELGIEKVGAADSAAAVCLLDASMYMRNQLLRDSDWASMAHSLELRTPLVDAALLEALKPYHFAFTGGRGKRMLAGSPSKPLPQDVIHRTKTGFGVPMSKWLASAFERTKWEQQPLSGVYSASWARRWAQLVMNSVAKGLTDSRIAEERVHAHAH